MDIFSKGKWSWVMSRNKKLSGKPDIVLPKWGTVVFVHGRFKKEHLMSYIIGL